MASHLSTPESVLMAPSKTFEVISAQIGFTRSERRHGFAFIPNPGMSTMIDEINRLAYDTARAAGSNVPHVGYAGPDPERAEKLAGRRKARHLRRPAPVVPVTPLVAESTKRTPLLDAIRSLDWARRRGQRPGDSFGGRGA